MLGSKWLDHFIVSLEFYLGEAREGNAIFLVRGGSRGRMQPTVSGTSCEVGMLLKREVDRPPVVMQAWYWNAVISFLGRFSSLSPLLGCLLTKEGKIPLLWCRRAGDCRVSTRWLRERLFG